MHPTEGVHQAQRMQEEFLALGVETEIVKDGYLRCMLDGKDILFDNKDVKFAVFFDKDKYFSTALEKAGVRVFNNSKAIKDCDDKGETYIQLSNFDIKMPKTIFAPLCYHEHSEIEYSSAKIIAKKLGFPMIVKESFGSMGNGINKVDNVDDLFAIMKRLKNKPHLFQEYLGYKKGTDIRIIVVGGKAIACMQRHNENDFRSNLAKGGKGTKITPEKQFIDTAEKCAKVLNLDYCGVDLLYGNEGEPIVCEVNSNAFFSGIESVTKVNVAKAYAKHILKIVR